MCVGASCLQGAVETEWTGPMVQWPNPRTLTGLRMAN